MRGKVGVEVHDVVRCAAGYQEALLPDGRTEHQITSDGLHVPALVSNAMLSFCDGRSSAGHTEVHVRHCFIPDPESPPNIPLA